MKIYLSGRMTGMPNLNAAEFARVAELMRAAGHEVYSPAEAFPVDQPFCHKAAWPAYAEALTKCDAIALLFGWDKSLGARTEFMIALNLKLSVYVQSSTDFWMHARTPFALATVTGDWELAGASKVIYG